LPPRRGGGNKIQRLFGEGDENLRLQIKRRTSKEKIIASILSSKREEKKILINYIVVNLGDWSEEWGATSFLKNSRCLARAGRIKITMPLV